MNSGTIMSGSFKEKSLCCSLFLLVYKEMLRFFLLIFLSTFMLLVAEGKAEVPDGIYGISEETGGEDGC